MSDIERVGKAAYDALVENFKGMTAEKGALAAEKMGISKPKNGVLEVYQCAGWVAAPRPQSTT
jgi:hypothetical protein